MSRSRFALLCARLGWLDEAAAALQGGPTIPARAQLALAAAFVTRGEGPRAMAMLAKLEREVAQGFGRDEWLDGAVTWYQCRRPDRAVAWARCGLAEEPGNVPAHLVLARCLLAAGYPKEALASLPARDEGDPGIAYWRARAALRGRDPGLRRSALDHLTRLGAADPPNPVAAFEAGRAHLTAGEVRTAVPLLAQAARQSYQEVLAHELLARAFHALGQDAKAAWANGRAQRLRGALKAAQASLRRSIALELAPLGPYLELSRALSLDGDPRAALHVLEQARARYPDDLDVTLAIADALNALDRFDDQARELESAAARHPERAGEPLRNLGKMYYETRQFDRVIPVLEHALRHQEADPEAHRYLGLALALHPDDPRSAERALAHLLRAAALDPSDATPWVTAGALLQRGGDLSEAAACYRQAIRADPGADGAYVPLAQALRRQHRAPEATFLLRLYRRARDLASRRRRLENRVAANRRDAEAHYLLGDHLFRHDSYRDAFPYLLIAASLAPRDSRVSSRLADVCALLDYVDLCG